VKRETVCIKVVVIVVDVRPDERRAVKVEPLLNLKFNMSEIQSLHVVRPSVVIGFSNSNAGILETTSASSRNRQIEGSIECKSTLVEVVS
jgi:hypothetical protein